MGRLNVFEGGSAINRDPILILSSAKLDLSGNKYENLRDQIDHFQGLKNNWDGYGGIPLLDEVGCLGKKLISVFLSSVFVDKISDIFPNPHGTLTFEWENTEGEKVSLEMGTDNYSYFAKFNNENPKFKNGEDIFSDYKDFSKELGKLFSDELPKLFLQE